MKKILIIEDENLVRLSLIDLLEAEGFEVSSAENGMIGIGLACKLLPDLIICDVMMPEIDGYGVLDFLQKEPNTAAIPFIFLTAKSGINDLRQGMELGADDYLTKPFTRATILKAIEARLARQVTAGEHSRQVIEGLRNNLARSLPHEFITPLSIIMMSSEILTGYSGEPGHEHTVMLGEKIRAAGVRLNTLIQKYLTYTEIELVATNPAKLEAWSNSRTDAPDKVIASLAMTKAEQVDRKADLLLELQEGSARIDATLLGKLVGELIDNALKYSKSGTTIRIINVPNPKLYILYVIDNGRGMSAQYIAQLGAYMQFERKRYEQQGLGLGLSIAKRLTELHGGQLSIESVPGQKTLVRVALPR